MFMDRLKTRLNIDSRPIVPVLRLGGVIRAGNGRLSGSGLNLAALDPLIKAAFSYPRAKAVALAINSPGGSPVQSALIHKRIRALAAEKNLPILAFCEDVAASGGYWLACAGDEIYADGASIVGSIGVITAGFGLEHAIKKLGIERRVHTSGDNKHRLDPFLPEKHDDVKKLKSLQHDMHEQFMALVRDRREGKLNGDEKDLFSGDFWTGTQALDLGLIDGLGDLYTVTKEKFGDKVQLRILERRQSWFRPRIGLNIETGTLADDLLTGIEERALWERVGL